MTPNYIYARDPATGEITIQIETPDNTAQHMEDVPSYAEYNELWEKVEKLENEIQSLENEMDNVSQSIADEEDCFWHLFATNVNSLDKDPLDIITDELKKRGLYLEKRRAA